MRCFSWAVHVRKDVKQRTLKYFEGLGIYGSGANTLKNIRFMGIPPGEITPGLFFSLHTQSERERGYQAVVWERLVPVRCQQLLCARW